MEEIKIQGSSVLKSDYIGLIDSYRDENKNNKPRKRNNTQTLYKVSVIVTIIAVVLVMLYILSGYGNIATLRNTLTAKEREIYELERVKMDREAEVAAAYKLAEVYEVASGILGMEFANETNTVYINIHKDNQEAEGLFGMLFSKLTE